MVSARKAFSTGARDWLSICIVQPPGEATGQQFHEHPTEYDSSLRLPNQLVQLTVTEPSIFMLQPLQVAQAK
jgi:hypothetical protein